MYERTTPIIVFSIFSFCIIIFPQMLRNKPTNDKLEIFIVGSIHSMHFNPDNHYSIIDLQTQIKALRPDIVCGEITPEAYEQEMEGYFPPEAAFLAQIASKLNYRFVPVDWRIDYATQNKADNEYPESVKEQVSILTNKYLNDLKESDCQSVYDFVHSETVIDLIDSVFEKIIGANPISEIAHGDWHKRNRQIVLNGLASSKDAQRVVFVFGGDHIPQIRRQLKSLGYDSKIPARLFIPSNDSRVPEEVINRWKRNLENLILIRDKKITTTEDNYNKVTNSRRIQDLELAIQKSSSNTN